MFLRNVGWLSTDYTSLYPRRNDRSGSSLEEKVAISGLRSGPRSLELLQGIPPKSVD
jgi:hypothetical protein